MENGTKGGRRNTRTTFESEVVGPILFRIPTEKDLWLVTKKVPTLPVARHIERAKKAAEAQEIDPESISVASDSLALFDALLLRCAISPRLVEESPVEIVDGEFPIEEVPVPERLKFGDALLRVAGFTAKEADELRPLSGTETPSSSSTS